MYTTRKSSAPFEEFGGPNPLASPIAAYAFVSVCRALYATKKKTSKSHEKGKWSICPVLYSPFFSSSILQSGRVSLASIKIRVTSQPAFPNLRFMKYAKVISIKLI